jgi:hypothetical protein
MEQSGPHSQTVGWSTHRSLGCPLGLGSQKSLPRFSPTSAKAIKIACRTPQPPLSIAGAPAIRRINGETGTTVL